MPHSLILPSCSRYPVIIVRVRFFLPGEMTNMDASSDSTANVDSVPIHTIRKPHITPAGPPLLLSAGRPKCRTTSILLEPRSRYTLSVSIWPPTSESQEKTDTKIPSHVIKTVHEKPRIETKPNVRCGATVSSGAIEIICLDIVAHLEHGFLPSSNEIFVVSI